MWSDNETDVDLLGFEFLLDSLLVVLSEPKLLPLTVGVLGDWGSGKSSLMKQACAELAADPGQDAGEKRRYVCVPFSPWRYEDYEDVKVSLMSTVLSQLAAAVPEQEEEQEEIGRLRALARKLRRPARRVARGGIGLIPGSVPLVAGTLDPSMDPQVLQLMQQAAQAGAAAAAQRLEDSPAPAANAGAAAAAEPITEVDDFRDRFAALMEALEDEVAAVVVFIDDLDRCLPETVVDTFEAIRLLLGAPRTAFVLAAHPQIVAVAIDARYPELRDDQRASGIGAQYLEKMLQQKITVPALAIPEAVTYVNLLLAELHLGDDEFGAVREHVVAQRATNMLEVIFDLGTLADLKIDAPPELVTDLQWAAQIAPVLAGGSRRNPRQLKQFLNTLQLRRLSAGRRKVSLDASILAKLMLLEDQQFPQFQQLFDWQVTARGASCPQLAAAEQLVFSEGDNDSDPQQDPPATDPSGAAEAPAKARKKAKPAAVKPVDETVRQWADKPEIQAWLQLPPRLGAVDLRPYFTYSRDRLSLDVVTLGRLSGRQQRLLQHLLGATGLRRAALEKLKTAPQADHDAVIEALARELLTTPEKAFTAVCEAMEKLPGSRDALFAALGRLPVTAVPAQQVATVAARLPADDPRTDALLTSWHNADRADLTGMVALVRKARASR
ncbi:hypothetical protein AMK25_05445 [Micromonospora sp. TSRI0369]|uniref:KAP family P-loop NTPase fold protein n=1 Tax=Micromonospora sp. TSRI0369 TaxID=1703936 RepID=UPI00093BBC84|nr:P-loop NTPase fold protein [Micromonospora sp. TSRI0369]OKJ46009.1 hypothetical protein AMK25_05445 [Micromonospora sp. TSRI0369]